MKTTYGRLQPVWGLLISLSLFACGGGDDGEVIGTGAKTITGTAAVGAAIAGANLSVKTETGVTKSTTTASDGRFQIDVNGEGPFLMRVEQHAGPALFSIAAGEGRTNIHPFTDLIIRNWFAIQGLDIESEFNSSMAPSQLPSLTDIADIEAQVLLLMRETLTQFSLSTQLSLFNLDFEANSQGFDAFLDHNRVIIINNTINIQVQAPDSLYTNNLASDLALSTDLTQADNLAPTTPGDLRAVAASNTEIIVVWQATSDNIGVQGYKVYRNTELLATTPYPVYSDTGLESGTEYCYQVEAVDAAGNVSAQASVSAGCTQTLAAPDTTAPAAASSVNAQASGSSSITLNWLHENVADVVAFDIYRGPSGNVTKIATTASTFFSDYGLTPNTNYCYAIVALDAVGNEADASQEACATTDNATTSQTGNSSLAFSNGVYTSSEGDATALITVLRSGSSSEAVSVDYTVSAGSATAGLDFVADSGTLNWAANDSSAKTFRVRIKGDTANSESTETVLLGLLNPSSNTTLGQTSNATLNINNSACNGTLAGNITVDTTISDNCTVVSANVTVRNNATLTINPGVSLIFEAGTGLYANEDGSISAAGTADKPILFTGLQPTPGYWSGIQFTFSNSVFNIIDHATVEFAGGSGGNGNANVVMFGGTASPQRLKISNTVLNDSATYGFEFDDGSIIDAFSNITATRNAAGPGILPANKIGALDPASDYSGNDIDELRIMARDVTQDQTWPRVNVPYSMGGHVIDANVSIAAGASLIFRANGYLDVTETGSLSAIGSANAPIVFTAEQPTPGYWQGIQYTFSNSINNALDYVIIEYGGSQRNGEANLTLFGVTPVRIKLSNSILRHSLKHGLEVDSGSLIDVFSNNVISENTSYPVVIPAELVGRLDAASVYSGNDVDLIFIENGNVNTTQTWPALDVPYNTGSHRINAHLTIEPGTTLISRTNGFLEVDTSGALSAIGTADNIINFTAESASPGTWSGIQFTFSNNINNVLDYVNVEYGGLVRNGGGGNVVLFGGVPSSASRATISNSSFQHSITHGIWLDTASIYNENSIVTTNSFNANASGDVVLNTQ